MNTRTTSRLARITTACALALAATLSSGCAVVAVTSTAVSVAASGVGLAADAAVGTVRITGRAIGAAADLVIPGGGQ